MSISNLTKKEIIRAFKKELEEKSFDKITVNDITNTANMHRQTFYYHFIDKYDLVSYICYNELFSSIVSDFDKGDYLKGFYSFIENIKKEQYFYKNILTSSAENNFKEYLLEVFKEIIERRSNNRIKKNSIEASFYANGIEGVIVSWCNNANITDKALAIKIEEITNDFLKNK